MFKKHSVETIFLCEINQLKKYTRWTEQCGNISKIFWFWAKIQKKQNKKRLGVMKARKKRSLSEENSHSHTPQEPLHKSRQCEGQRGDVNIPQGSHKERARKRSDPFLFTHPFSPPPLLLSPSFLSAFFNHYSILYLCSLLQKP